MSGTSLNIQPHQRATVNKSLKQEIVSFSSSQTPQWQSPFSIFIRNSGGLICHEAVLVMTQSAPITGLTGTVTDYPNLSPTPFLFSSLDIIINGVTVDTRRNDEQFILSQITSADETRVLQNFSMGNYTSVKNRASFNAANGKYYFPLQIPIINAANFKILSQSSEIEMKFNMNSAQNVINQSTLTGTPVLNWSSAEVLLRCTRLPPAIVQNEISQIVREKKHYLYHRLLYAPYNLNQGISNASITLSTLNGNVSHLMFVSRANNAQTGLNQWNYLPIKYAAGASLTGGRPILDKESRLNHSRYWSKSSYLSEVDMDVPVSKSNCYIYSFSADPILALASGAKLNSHKFSGQELLNITLPVSLVTASTLEVYAFQEAVLEHNASGIKVLTTQ